MHCCYFCWPFMECISMELARNHGQFILIPWVSAGAKSQKLFTFIFWVILVSCDKVIFSIGLVNCIYLYFFLFDVCILLKNVNVCINWLKENESHVRRCLLCLCIVKGKEFMTAGNRNREHWRKDQKCVLSGMIKVPVSSSCLRLCGSQAASFHMPKGPWALCCSSAW